MRGDAALAAIDGTPWLMLPKALEQLRAIAAGDGDTSPKALEAYRARQLARAERAGVRNGVAVLEIAGPIFRKSNLLVEFSGASSCAILRRDLQVALDDPEVSAILLDFDSPGGEVDGIAELAKAIYEARSKKPILAYVSAMACSAAMWLASAASRIVVSPSAIVGSIGVVSTMRDEAARDQARGVRTVQVVSSNAPDKRPDISTEEGRAVLLAILDDLEAVFISDLSRYRGISAAKIKALRGGVRVGEKAIAAGLADEIGTFEGTLASLARPAGARHLAPQTVAPPPGMIRAEIKPGIFVSFASQAEADAYVATVVQEAVAAGAREGTAEARRRLELAEAIRSLPGAALYPAEAEALIKEGLTTVAGAEAVFDGLKRAGVPTSAEKSREAMMASYIDRKIAAGSLVIRDGVTHNYGTGAEGVNVGSPTLSDFDPNAAEQEAIKAGWAKAVAAANAKFGAGAVTS